MLIMEVLKDTVGQKGLNFPGCPRVGKRGMVIHILNRQDTGLRKKCLVQVHHMELMNHMLLRKAAFYNL